MITSDAASPDAHASILTGYGMQRQTSNVRAIATLVSSRNDHRKPNDKNGTHD